MDRYNPKNRQEAFCFQFEDTLQVLKGTSHNEDVFDRNIVLLKAQIKAYESEKLRESCRISEEVTKERTEQLGVRLGLIK